MDPVHELIDARAEGTALRNSVLVFEASLRHLALQFLVFGVVLLLALVLAFLAARADAAGLGAGLRAWLPGLGIVLGFGACAFLVQYLRVLQIRGSTRIVLEQIDRAIVDSMVVVDSRS
jgi:hypothetical protein